MRTLPRPGQPEILLFGRDISFRTDRGGPDQFISFPGQLRDRWGVTTGSAKASSRLATLRVQDGPDYVLVRPAADVPENSPYTMTPVWRSDRFALPSGHMGEAPGTKTPARIMAHGRLAIVCANAAIEARLDALPPEAIGPERRELVREDILHPTHRELARLAVELDLDTLVGLFPGAESYISRQEG